jgi:hypothetical protein
VAFDAATNRRRRFAERCRLRIRIRAGGFCNRVGSQAASGYHSAGRRYRTPLDCRAGVSGDCDGNNGAFGVPCPRCLSRGPIRSECCRALLGAWERGRCDTA